jgi:hypothetical protein
MSFLTCLIKLLGLNTASAPNDEAPNTSTNVTKVGGRKKGSKTNLVKENEKKGASHKL